MRTLSAFAMFEQCGAVDHFAGGTFIAQTAIHCMTLGQILAARFCVMLRALKAFTPKLISYRPQKGAVGARVGATMALFTATPVITRIGAGLIWAIRVAGIREMCKTPRAIHSNARALFATACRMVVVCTRYTCTLQSLRFALANESSGTCVEIARHFGRTAQILI